MRKRKLFIIGSIVLLLVSIVSFNFYTGRQKCKGDDRPIPFKRLSNEKNFPFHWGRRPLSYWKDKKPNYEDYRAAVASFPDVRACLVDSEQEKQTPNLSHFDWNKIKWLEEADVCAYRVFSSIGTLEGSKQWLEGQGFEIKSVRKEGPDTRIYALWPKICGKRYEEPWNWIRAIHEILIEGDFWLSVWITVDNEFKSSNSYFISK